MSTKISLNTDIGEGYGLWRIADDGALLDLVTDANLACGFHAGDPNIMRETCDVAAARGISVGAQVGYYDLRGFGRRRIEIPPQDLLNDVLYQLGALSAFTSAAGIRISYLKIHGALYHAAIAERAYAEAVIGAVKIFDSGLPFMCQPGTALYAAVDASGLRPICEGYIDRAYSPDGLLVPRGVDGAVISDPARCAERAVMMATDGRVESVTGTVIEVPVDSVCIHSDSPGAVAIARAVRTALEGAGVDLVPLG